MSDVLIWGASGGIGRAFVEHCKEQSWRVFAAARQEAAIPPQADAVLHFDAADPFTFQQVAMSVAQQTDGLDLVVYAAGGLVPALLEKMSADEWAAVLDANLTGAFLAAQVSVGLLKPGGHMMLLGAFVPKITLPRMGAYAVAKAGLEILVSVLQKENRKLKITLVRLPAVDTPFWVNVPFRLPPGALAPGEVAAAALKHFYADGSGELDLSSAS